MSNILKYLYPTSILAGTIIGAGMFSLPFIFQAAGLWLGAAYLVFFTFVFWLIHTMYADIMLRTERLPGFVLYAEKYLGSWASIPATLVTVFGIIFAFAVYLVLSVSFTRLLFPDISEPLVVYSFWALGSLAIFLKVNRLAMLEFIVVSAIVIIIGIIFYLGIFSGNYSMRNFSALPASLPMLFLPFGPVLFALAGRSAIPSLLEDAKKIGISDLRISSIIFWGTAIPGIFYLGFVLGIWGLSGIVSEDAVSGITRGGPVLLSALGATGTLTLFSTYIPLGIGVKKILEADFNLSHITSGVIVVVSPMLIYLTGIGFLKLIAITGGIFLAVESIFIALIWNKLNILGTAPLLLKDFGTKTAYAITGVFLVGMFAEILNMMPIY